MTFASIFKSYVINRLGDHENFENAKEAQVRLFYILN